MAGWDLWRPVLGKRQLPRGSDLLADRRNKGGAWGRRFTEVDIPHRDSQATTEQGTDVPRDSSREEECVARGVRELWLTVNKDNAGPIAFYQRVGFAIAGPVVTDIGGGFAMDDYQMVKSLVD